MTYAELREAGIKLLANAENVDLITIGNMLGTLDMRINSQSFYITFIIDLAEI